MSEDFYDLLGVDRGASKKEIQRSYRKKAARYHPDVSDDPDAEEKFKKIKKAKEVLSDEDKRAAYDRLGHERFIRAEKQGGFDGPSGRGAAGSDPFSGGDPFGGFGDIFEQFFGRGDGRARRNGPRQGADLRTKLTIDLDEAFHGSKKRLTVTRPEQCTDCNGSGHPDDAAERTCPECNGHGQVTRIQQSAFGRVQQTQTCRHCGGEGRFYDETCTTCRGNGTVQREANLTVEIPKGIRDGQTLRMDGEGAPGENGGRNGDLLIDITIRDHPEFERNGDDLHYRLPISFPQAVFGDTIKVPTLDVSVKLDIPEGTQSGEVFTIDNRGMPKLRRRGRGDLHVQVQVVTPQNLDKKQREALEAFAEVGGEEIDVEKGFFERLRGSF